MKNQKSKDARKSCIQFRVTKEEHDLIKNKAEINELSISEYSRDCVLNYDKKKYNISSVCKDNLNAFMNIYDQAQTYFVRKNDETAILYLLKIRAEVNKLCQLKK